MGSLIISDMNELQNMPVLLNTVQTARLLATSEKYVRDMLGQDKIKGVKIGGKWFVHRDALLTQLGLVDADD